MSKITWIQLSDLHFGKDEVDKFKQKLILNKLAEDVSQQIQKHNLKIDFIFLTGDIAFRGEASEYNEVSKFITMLAERANVLKENILIVPGNHDIERSELLRKLPSPKSNNEVSKLIGDKTQIKPFTDSFENFREFVHQMNGQDRYKNSNMFYVVNQVVRGKSVAVMALNTAWLTGKDVNPGDAVLGERQVREALQEANDADIIITLMHHPFSWLTEDDNNIAKRLLEKRTDFILSGHIHKISDVGKASLFGEAFNITSGSIYGDSYNSNAYNIVQCDFSVGFGKIFFRQYISDNAGYWSVDNTVDQSIPDGIATFKLPSRIPIENPNAQDKIVPTLETQLNELSKINKLSVPKFPKVLPSEIKKGNCVLFAGAGTSVDAGLPTWNELLRNMIDELNNQIVLEEDINAELISLLGEGRNLIVAEYCRIRLGEHLFSEFIRNNLKTKNRRSVIHQILSDIPFSAVLTTNYDGFLEKYRDNSRIILPAELSELGYRGIKRISEDSIPIVKLHGSFDNPKSIIFSDSDYRKALYSSPDYRAAVSELLTDKTCLFVGFSLVDNNILAFLQSILESNKSSNRKHFVVACNTGKVVQYYNKYCLNVETINIDNYSQLEPLLRKIKDESTC